MKIYRRGVLTRGEGATESIFGRPPTTQLIAFNLGTNSESENTADESERDELAGEQPTGSERRQGFPFVFALLGLAVLIGAISR